MKIKIFVALFLVAALMFATLHAPVSAQGFTADLIIINANVHTMDKTRPVAQAVAIYGNRIVAVGTTNEIKGLAGGRTRIIDARGQLVLPGFNDSHVHFLSGGFQLSSVNLRDAKSPEEFAEIIHQFAEKTKSGRWITGGDWDHERWPVAALPTKEMIDPFTPDTPVYVSRLDGHMGLANSLALKLAGVTRETKDPAGGLIVRDAKTGEPTGILKDAAQSLVENVIPEPSLEEKLAATKAATEFAARYGVTSVQDMSAGNDVGVYQMLLERSELKTRIYGVSPLPDWQRLGRTGIHARFGSDMLRIGGLKGYADGSLGATTAMLFEPYVDAPNTHGLFNAQMYPAGEMQKRVIDADKAGLQVMIHAIGDRANDEILKIYEAAIKENGARDRRFRIEHAQHLRPQDIARFGRDHVIASMQPYHAIDDGRWAEKRIGHQRALTTYAFRTLLDTGATLAFGTDWTVAPIDPMLGIYAAVTRRTLDGRNPNGWIPDQKISVEEAVRAYTVGSAYAEFMENEKGTITTGKLADLVILSQDIFSIPPVEIEHTHVITTIMDGRIVYNGESRSVNDEVKKAR